MVQICLNLSEASPLLALLARLQSGVERANSNSDRRPENRPNWSELEQLEKVVKGAPGGGLVLAEAALLGGLAATKRAQKCSESKQREKDDKLAG